MRAREESGSFALLTTDLDRRDVKSIAQELADAERIETYLSELRQAP